MSSMRLQAFSDLFSRYGRIWRQAWGQRRELDAPERTSDELAFLPANLELADTPAHPAARWAIRVIILLTFCVLLLAIFGQLDIVATARGRFIPDARVKVIQPAITGVVRNIGVRDGERVKAGQVLVELDATQAAADSEKIRLSLADGELAAARARALLNAAERNASRLPKLAVVKSATAERQADAQRLADSAWREYRDRLAVADAELRKREAELASIKVQIARLRATAPLARRQADDYARLAQQSYVARHDSMAKEQAALEQEHDLDVQHSRARQLEASIAEQKAERSGIDSQFRRMQSDALNKAIEQVAQDRNNETKATTRQDLLILRSPVDGTVKQLAVHTLGGVVTTAQTLMEIVPDDALEVEVNIENKDIGFVNVGQDAIVKIDAFPYTRYGYLKGTVTTISKDAVQDRRLGLIFVARVRVEDNKIKAQDKWVNLSPGMAVSAEIRTGRRSVARYFLDPLITTSQESLRER